VSGIDPAYSGLLHVDMSLSRTPEPEWRQFFEHPTGVSISVSMHPPTVAGSKVLMRPPDDQVAKYVSQVDDRIAAANRQYEQVVLPHLEREARAADAANAEANRRIEEARKRLDDP
jgi:hypothetical protein